MLPVAAAPQTAKAAQTRTDAADTASYTPDKFFVHRIVLRLLHTINIALLEGPYDRFGRADHNLKRFTIVLPSSFGSDRRKPITPQFQQFCEAVYWPIVWTLHYGNRDAFGEFVSSVKVNTNIIGEDTDYYGKPVYHMHLDHKIGHPQPRNNLQCGRVRIIYSIVESALPAEADWRENRYKSTVYLKEQPIGGFSSQNEFHRYMRGRFVDVGTPNGKGRPLYEIPDADVCRSSPGGVNWHTSHTGYPIHAEPNPCPEGRWLLAFDFEDFRAIEYSSKAKRKRRSGSAGVVRVGGRREVPLQQILEKFRVLSTPSSPRYLDRLHATMEVVENVTTAARLFGCEREVGAVARAVARAICEHREA